MNYECHGHIMLDGVSYSDAAERHKNGVCDKAVRKNLKSLADSDVTFFRDGGDRLSVSARAKQLAPEYGIDYRTPVFMIYKKGHYGGLFGRPFDDMAGFLRLVMDAKRMGADFIKIAASGMLDFSGGGALLGPALSEDELREMVKIAGGEGFAVMAHVNGAENIKNALAAGVASIEHGFWPDSEAAELFAHTGAVWTPTRAAVSNLAGYDGAVLRRVLDDQARALQHAHSLGALIASGSDSGAASVAHGIGTLEEYALLDMLGIDPARGNAAIAGTFCGGVNMH